MYLREGAIRSQSPMEDSVSPTAGDLPYVDFALEDIARHVGPP